MEPLIEKARQAYVPCDYKAALNKLLELYDNDDLDECIAAGGELLKDLIPRLHSHECPHPDRNMPYGSR